MLLELANHRGQQKSFLFKKADISDVNAVFELQDYVYNKLENKDLLITHTKPEIENLIKDNYGICVYQGKELVGYSMLTNGSSDHNVGKHLGYSDEELLKTVSFLVTFISPDCRGYGLQNELIHIREKICRELEAKRVLTTISPDNIYSLNNIIRNGFLIVGRFILYDKYDRYILIKNLEY